MPNRPTYQTFGIPFHRQAILIFRVNTHTHDTALRAGGKMIVPPGRTRDDLHLVISSEKLIEQERSGRADKSCYQLEIG